MEKVLMKLKMRKSGFFWKCSLCNEN